MKFEPNESHERRRSNAAIALWIVIGMGTLAGLAAIATILTTDWRRAGDSVRPELPSFGQSLLVSLGIFFGVCVLIGAICLWVNRRQL